MGAMTSASPDPAAPTTSGEGDSLDVLPAGGTVRSISRWGDPVMHRVLEPVTQFDDELRQLAADMVATMYAADGVGLAANQIGVELSVFVYDCPDASGRRHAGHVVNPVLVSTGDGLAWAAVRVAPLPSWPAPSAPQQ